jgi:hypothetical protein
MQDGFFAYWWRVAMRTTKDTFALTGNSLGKSIVGLISTLAICAIGFSFIGDKASEKILWSAIGLIPGSTIFITCWAWFFLRTPWQLECDLRNKHEEELQKAWGQATGANEELEEAIKSHAEEMQKEAARFIRLQTEIDTKPATVADVREAMKLIAKNGHALMDADCTVKEWVVWFGHAKVFVKGAFRTSYHQDFEGRSNCQNNYDPQRGHFQRMSECLDWLNGWVGKISESEINPDCTQAWIREQSATQN